jgi:RNA polymerase sigma factor (sigma-70 family)
LATAQINRVIQHLRRVVLSQDAAGRTDGQLLESFISQKDEAAFEALVHRHGPMVLAVCRRVLRNYHDAEDAFQAAFLILARKSSSVRPRERVANWLHGVAYRTALKARAMTAKRQARERQVRQMPEPEVAPPDHGHDLQPLLDQALNGLPETYRLPVLLCDLERKSIKEAARQLGWPQGTLAGRLARGRKMLAARLARRGLVASTASLAAALSQHVVCAGVPAFLVSSTVKAASLTAAGQMAVAGMIPVKVAALMEGVMKAMLITKLKTVTAALLIVAGAGIGGGLISRSSTAAAQNAGESLRNAADTPQARPTRTGRLIFGIGVNSDAGIAGSVTLNEQNFVTFVDSGTLVGQQEAVPAAPKTVVPMFGPVPIALDFGFPIVKASEGSAGHIKPASGPQEYKAFFNKALAVMGDYFEEITYANRYDGRIEASTVPVKDQPAIIRRAAVSISASGDGRFAISVRVDKVVAEGGKSGPVGRDKELERAILQRLNVEQDQNEKPPALSRPGSTNANAVPVDRQHEDVERVFRIAEFYQRTGHIGAAYYYYEKVSRSGDRTFAPVAKEIMADLKERHGSQVELEGEWKGRVDGAAVTLVFGPKDSVLQIGGDGQWLRGTYSVDFKKHPHHLNLHWKEPVGKFKTGKFQTIMQFEEGGRVRIELSSEDEPRPQKFTAEAVVLVRDFRSPSGEKGHPSTETDKTPPQPPPRLIDHGPPQTSAPDSAEKKSARVGEIIIVGNTKTAASVLLKKIPLYPGAVLDHQALRTVEKNLAAFDPTITVVENSDRPDFKDILVTVKE